MASRALLCEVSYRINPYDGPAAERFLINRLHETPKEKVVATINQMIENCQSKIHELEILRQETENK
jgi:hypothetical protein